LDSENQIDVLTRLGLTCNQAKIFLALAKLEPSTVAQIAKSANLAREVVYRTLPTLQKMGLITKTISFPTRYNAISPEVAVKILFKIRDKETLEVKAKVGELLKQMSQRLENIKDKQIISIIGKERVSIFAKRQMMTTKVSLDTMMTYPRYQSWLCAFTPIFKKLLAKKVKIRVIVPCSKVNDKQQYSSLLKDGNFLVKFIPDELQTFVGIIDDKDTMINTGLNQFSFYWSNDLGIISLSKAYFEKYWAYPEVNTN
jgi:sugar-specific transcriptional regulator TrmB